MNVESADGQGARIILEIPLRSDSQRENAYVNASLAG